MRCPSLSKLFPLSLIAAALFSATPVFAACTNPSANAGDIQYSAAQGIMAYCNGSNWIAMGSQSTTTFGTLTPNDFCTATSGTAIQCTTAFTGTGDVVLATSPHMTGPIVDSGGLTVTAGGASITGTVTGTTFSGSGASLTSIGTTNLTAVTGTPSSTTFLRGDNTWSAVTLGTGSITGVVTVPQGGTGDTTLTAHGLLVGNGTNAVATTAAGPAGALLLGQGGSADPSFAAMSQDCAITNAGVITCTRTNNVAFGALATASSVNLASQVSGVLPIANGGMNASSQTTNGVNYYNGTSITSGTGFVYSGSSVGIGTASPTANLTVNGTSAFQFGTDYSTTGTQNDVSLGSVSSVRYTGSGVATFNGIGGGVNGRVLYLHNGSSSTLTLADKASADTTYANQIVTGTGSDLSVSANSALILQYDASATNSNGASGAWRVIGGSGSGGGSLSGGTANTLAYWTGATTLGTANVYYSGGNVGIGTAAPAAILHSYGSSEQLRLGYDATHYTSLTVDSAGNWNIVPSGGYVNIGANYVNGRIRLYDSAQATGDGSIYYYNGDLELVNGYGNVVVSSGSQGRTLALREYNTPWSQAQLWYDGSSNTGTGLHIQGGTSAGSILLTLGTTSSSPNLQVQNYGGTSLLYVGSTGPVGISTTAPQSLVHAYGGEVEVGSSGNACNALRGGAIRFNGSTLYYCDGTSTWTALSSGGASVGTSQITGVVTVPQGGTGVDTLTAHGLVVGNGTNAVAVTAAGSAGALLLGQGGSADPSFAAMSQDCAITNAGVITCTRTNNVAFGALATASSVNLATQVSGVLPIANGGMNASSQTTNGVNYYNGTSITSGTGFVYNGSSVGIGTATPTAALTVNGASAFQFGTDYSTTGTQNDVSLGSTSSVRYTGSGVATFNGIGGGVNGRVLYLHNGSSSVLTLADKASADTTYANQIVTGTGSNLSVAANSAVILQYDVSATNSNGASGAWRVIGGSGSAATGTGSAGYDAIWTSATTIGTGLLYESGGNVGIGTTAPVTRLDVWTSIGNGSGAFTGQIVDGTNDGLTGGLLVSSYLPRIALNDRSTSANWFDFRNDTDKLIIGYGVDASLYSRTSDLMTMTTDGYLGIGITTPTANLDVRGTRTDTSGTQYLNYGLLTVSPASASASTFYGSYGRTVTSGAADIATISGAYGRAEHDGTGLLATMNGGGNVASNDAAGTVTNARGAWNSAESTDNAGIITNAYGAYNRAYSTSSTATNIATAYGSYNLTYNNGTGSITTAYGAYANTSNHLTGSIGTAYGVRGRVDNQSTGAITTAYSLYGDLNNAGSVTTWYGLYIAGASGAGTTTTKYPLYINDTGSSYFAGNIGIGTATPLSKLQAYGGEVQVGTSGNSCTSARGGAIRFSGSTLYYCDGTSTWTTVSSGGASVGTSQITGVLTVPQGGTGDVTLTAHGLLVGNGTNAVAVTAAGASGALLLGQGGSADPSFAAMSQDCTITNAGVITCTKTNNVSFAASATTDTTSATNITSGTLPTGRLSGSYTGITGVGTLTAGTWNAGTIGIGYGGTNATTQTTNGVNYYNGTSVTSGTGFVYTGSQVGIGTATPTAALTVNGTSAFQFGTDYSTTGTQNDVSLGSVSSVRYTGSGVATFNGIGGGVNGRVLYLHNGSSSVLTLADKASADTTYANQIVTGTGSNLSVAANSAVILQYDASATNSNGASGAWRVIGGSGSGGGSLSGGTANTLAYWTGATTLGTANVYYSGGNVGIGTAAPTSKLTLGGQESWSVGLGAITHLAGPGDHAFAVAATAPTQVAASVAGNSLTLNASSATAGSSTSGGADGGTITLTAGNAAYRTSGSPTGGGVTLLAGTGANNGNGGAVTITAGDSGPVSWGAGGDVTITGGNGEGKSGDDGGNVSINGADGGIFGAGGSVTAMGVQNGAAAGGGVTIAGGGDPSTNGVAGSVTITAGSALYAAGNISLTAGSPADGGANDGGAVSLVTGGGKGSGVGGALALTTGSGGPTGNGGNITITAGAGGSTSGNGGNVILSPGTVTSGTVGRVGIGTTTPQSLVHAYGGEVQVGSSGASCASARGGAIRFNGSTLYYCDGTSTWTALSSGSSLSGGTANTLAYWTGATTLGTANVYYSGGSVGVGTASPASLLSVGGSSQLTVDGSGNIATSGGISQTAADTNLAFTMTNTSSTAQRWPNISIVNYTGTYGAYGGLNIKTSRGSQASSVAVLNGDYLGTFNMWGQYDTTYGHFGAGAAIAGVASGNFSASSFPTDLVFFTTPSGSTSEAEHMRITSAGNVGIGTAIPTATLDVNGTAKATTFSGSGASLTGIGTSNMTAVTGTPSSSTYLRGDNTWAAVSGGEGTSTYTVQSSAPFTCDSSHDGVVALSSAYKTCVCRNGTGWVTTSDGTTTCRWEFATLLLHNDGADASTTFTDSASSHVMAAYGNAQIDTAQSQFGGASGYFDGSGDYVETPDSADWTFGSEDFTVDLWFNRNGGNATTRYMLEQCNSSANYATVSVGINLTAANVVRANTRIDTTSYEVIGTTAFTATGWHPQLSPHFR